MKPGMQLNGANWRRGLIIALLALGLSLTGRNSGAQVVFSAATGHYYEGVVATFTWSAARDAAAARTYMGRHGHLVTITSAAEQAFVTGTFPQAASNNWWIGAYQDRTAPDYREPAGGWRWTTGEAWSYTAWNDGEPNNAGGIGPSEEYGRFAGNGLWNDFGTSTSSAAGYIVEYEFPRPSFDINGDGFADILFQNATTNQIAFWYMNGTNYTNGAFASAIPAAGYVLRGTGDFSNDGVPDLVFQNSTSGQLVIWFMNGSSVSGGVSVVQVPAQGYQLVGVGDFNTDGSPDLVFQNSATGQIAVWYMNWTTLIGFESTRVVPGGGYRIVGIGDFNGDGNPDLVFQNNGGPLVFWFMNGAQFQSGLTSTLIPQQNYRIVGVSDYNNDAQPDLLLQNSVTGQVVLWYMNGTTFAGGGLLSAVPGSNYLVAGPH